MNLDIYCITCIETQKRYVGYTSLGYETRWKVHVANANAGVQTHLYNAIRKYGVQTFLIERLQSCSTLQELKEAEKHWIAELQTSNPEKGFNMTTGGDGVPLPFGTSGPNAGRVWSDEVKEKISQTLSRKMTGEGNNFFGKHHSPDARAKISASKVGKLLTTRRLRTQEQDRPIVEAFKANKTRSQICEELSVTPAKVQKALARWKERVEPDLNVGKEHQYENSGAALQKLALERNQPVIDLFESGKSRKEIASELDITYAQVKQVISRYLKRKLT